MIRKKTSIAVAQGPKQVDEGPALAVRKWRKQLLFGRLQRPLAGGVTGTALRGQLGEEPQGQGLFRVDELGQHAELGERESEGLERGLQPTFDHVKRDRDFRGQ